MSSIVNFTTLNKPYEFSNTYKKAKSFHTKYLVTFYLESDSSKVGFVASKKVGKATIRNRAKRRLRSIFRDLDLIEKGIFILVAKAGIEDADFDRIKKDINFALKKTGAIQGK